jgi:CubicO group peptidase (beta-lactamase class C family)
MAKNDGASITRLAWGEWRRNLSCGALGLLLALVPGCVTPVRSLDPARLEKIDAAIGRAMDESRLPGAVVWVEHGSSQYCKAYGHRALVPAAETMTDETIFDVASLTKVLATAPAVMILWERGQIKLDDPVQSYIPEFTGDGKERITVRQLLTHTSGLPEGISTRHPWQGAETAIRMACAAKLKSPPGREFLYSDVNFILLGEIVARVSHASLNEFCAREIYRPLKIVDTGFLPGRDKIPRIAPTQMTGGVMLRGVVHDPTARFMGGVAGHAGVFSTAPDLARYARMMLNLGELDGARILKPDTVRMMTSTQTPPGLKVRRGFGWDIDSGYSAARGGHFPIGSYGHTGFTGAAVWIDPFSRTFFIFLSNRVHPDGSGNVLELYRAVSTLAAEAVTDFDFR